MQLFMRGLGAVVVVGGAIAGLLEELVLSPAGLGIETVDSEDRIRGGAPK